MVRATGADRIGRSLLAPRARAVTVSTRSRPMGAVGGEDQKRGLPVRAYCVLALASLELGLSPDAFTPQTT
jgi:hypothetical protein